MDSIAWEIRYALPNQRYIAYVRDNLLGESAAVDPFSPFVFSKASDLYIQRDVVEAEIVRPEHRFILGPAGRGGTTLARWLVREMLYSVNASRYRTLAVDIPLPDAQKRASTDCRQGGPLQFWSFSQLIALIFDAYWSQIVIEPLNQVTLFQRLRRDREWMLKLRWFYRHYPPRHYQVLHDFELLTWLNSDLPHNPFSPHSRDLDILGALLKFVVTVPIDPRTVIGEAFYWPYQKVTLVFDLTGDLDVEAFNALLRMLQALRNVPALEFKVFLDSQWAQRLETWPDVMSGYMPIYQLPRWQASELRALLDKRIDVYGGVFEDYEGYMTNWGDSLSGLQRAGRRHFRQIVIDGALRVYEQAAEFDAPIHALKLVRGLIAACAGCWEERYPPPLNACQLQDIVDLYWGGE